MAPLRSKSGTYHSKIGLTLARRAAERNSFSLAIGPQTRALSSKLLIKTVRDVRFPPQRWTAPRRTHQRGMNAWIARIAPSALDLVQGELLAIEGLPCRGE